MGAMVGGCLLGVTIEVAPGGEYGVPVWGELITVRMNIFAGLLGCLLGGAIGTIAGYFAGSFHCLAREKTQEASKAVGEREAMGVTERSLNNN